MTLQRSAACVLLGAFTALAEQVPPAPPAASGTTPLPGIEVHTGIPETGMRGRLAGQAGEGVACVRARRPCGHEVPSKHREATLSQLATVRAVAQR